MRYCLHENYRITVEGGEHTDSTVRSLAFTIICANPRCGQHFRVVGVGACEGDLESLHPSSLDGGRTTVIPIIPEGECPELMTMQ